ncbi:thiamine pyrophosphate-binding protein [Demequina sp. NBRC 110054]|uniref:thiamine pyrophosphate-binding protein n=1 Tax=Demequina sp. NBRC 110054 TaxID=1570343 RepID=UPI0013563DDE|nr:thiamine pyrophosphate-binding protein [Demequina sp. NBRC 110054]
MTETPTPTAPATVGVRVVELLERLGVDTVFGIPGSHNLSLFDGLARSSVRLVSPRHEQGAGFAADGYARATGRPGVLITTTGPGILNAATALATAYADSIPVLAISTGARIADEGRELGWLHETKAQHASIDGLVTSVRCRSEQQVYAAIVETFARWQVERTRPVNIEVPLDLLAETAASPLPEIPSLSAPAPSARAIAAAAQAVARARRPILVAGGGALGARDELEALASLVGAPLVTTRAGAGLRYAGPDGADPTTVLPYAPEVLAEHDLMIVIGSELSRRDVPEPFRAGLPPVVRVDIEPARLTASRAGDVLIVADAAEGVAALVAALEGESLSARDRAAEERRLAEAVHASYPGPLRGLHEALERALGADAIITGDSSQVSYLGTGVHYGFSQPRSFLYPDGFAPLGFGLPAAIGASLGGTGRRVTALVGDGAFLFSVQELSTAVAERAEVLVLVVENDGYKEIEEEMEAAGVSPVGVRFDYPDPVAVAAAFGATSARASSLDELESLIRRMSGTMGPVVIAIREDSLG